MRHSIISVTIIHGKINATNKYHTHIDKWLIVPKTTNPLYENSITSIITDKQYQTPLKTTLLAKNENSPTLTPKYSFTNSKNQPASITITKLL